MKELTITAIVSVFVVTAAFAQDKPMATDVSVPAVVPTSATAKTVSSDTTWTLQYFIPGDDDAYDYGLGGEIQTRAWYNANVGFAVAGGLARWDVLDEEGVESDDLYDVAISIDGSILLTPIGGSILIRPTLANILTITLECGLRYVFVRSDIQVDYAVVNAHGAALTGRANLDIDDGIIGLIAANLEAELSPRVSLLVGVGYQFDVDKGAVKWMGEDLGDNELKAAFLRVGIATKF